MVNEPIYMAYMKFRGVTILHAAML